MLTMAKKISKIHRLNVIIIFHKRDQPAAKQDRSRPFRR